MLKKSLIYLLLLLLLQSCAVFRGEPYEVQNLNSSNIESINGRYEISSQEYQKRSNDVDYHNLFRELDRKVLRDTLELDIYANYCIELEIVSKDKLNINYLEDNKAFRSRTIKYKLKKNGHLYLKNKNIGFSLIPYIFGGLDVKRSRLALDNGNNLVFDVSHFQGGAVALIIFLDMGTARYKQVYSRIE